MSKSRYLPPRHVYFLNGTKHTMTGTVQSVGSHPHHAAAAFAVVPGRLFHFYLADGRQAGVAWSAAGVELRQVAEPRVATGVGSLVVAHDAFIRFHLGVEPVLIGIFHIELWRVAYAFHESTCQAQQHSVGGEERHLRVVADHCHALVEHIAGDSFRTKSPHDLTILHKLHRIPQRIACGSSNQ